MFRRAHADHQNLIPLLPRSNVSPMRDLDNSAPRADRPASEAEHRAALRRVAADLAAMRVDYGGVPSGSGEDVDLDEAWLAGGWEPLLRNWIEQATAVDIAEPNAMVLATVAVVDGVPRPASRTVLCKGLSPEGVTFYTNYDSAKGTQLAAVPYAAATFVWPALGRQVHLRGPVERTSAEQTAVYWRSRPRDSQLGAWASQQSRPIDSRAALDRALAEVTARFAGVEEIPVPPHWGGYLLRPEQVEFWQGRRGRLHNRLLVRVAGERMTVERLQP
ncbi:pyridoxamine 5'-phosphate oxidase [Nocardia farcinica]|nr:pyridoxamine 5'-phosphate oxidase [Nocardia farcinica]MBF6312728.1 pyridoxamine 5'-phosphate oxidase [Nocardia farcinica]MBF6408417.1 pyridoxamine 5'-phosphate oxidase [Nocardia farcinica]PEH80173.1 pyridoxamine 5'-phosphate oxidase [Nocardia sp. FDAARGOS_372]